MKKALSVKILVGLPASGKSTYTKDFLKRNQDWVSVSRDTFRYGLRNEGWTEDKIEKMISELVDVTIIKCLNKKLNVIIDATNLKKEYIDHFVDLVKYKANVEFNVFDVPVETCIERDKNRERSVGEKVIRDMYKQWKIIIDSNVFISRPMKPTHEDRFLHAIQDKSLPQAAIFDIDDTLAIMGRRGPFDWHKVDIDDPNHFVIEQIEFHKSKNRKIILLSGRDETAREGTEYWLNFYNIQYDELYMRPKDSGIKDTKLKKDIYLENIKPNYYISAVYDVRLSVLNMWASLGLFAFNVNNWNKEF